MPSRRHAVLLCAIASIAALAPAQTTRPAGLTQHDKIAAELAFNRRRLVEGFDKEAVPKDALEKDARAFLERFAVYLTNVKYDKIYQLDGDSEPKPLLPLAKALAKCESPIVQCSRAVILEHDDVDAAKKIFERYAPVVAAGDYTGYERYQAARALARLWPKKPEHVKQMNDLIVPMLLDVTTPAERHVVMRTAINDMWEYEPEKRLTGLKREEREAVLDAYAKSPNADPWMLAVLRGEHEVNTAWEFRGSGWGNQVKAQGWAGFEQHIALARRALTAAHELEPNQPDAAAKMITVCKAESNAEEARVWFDRAKAAQIDHEDAWMAYRSVLRPRWGGSVDAMQKLGEEALLTGRFDTLTPFFARSTFYDMKDEDGLGEAAMRRPGVWEAMDMMVDGYINPPQHGIDVRYWKSRRATYAYECGRYAEAMAIMDALGRDFDPVATARINLTPADFRTECVAKNGLRVELYRKLDAMVADDEVPAAHSAYATILAELPADDPDRPYVLQHERATALAEAFARNRPAVIATAAADHLAAWSGDTSPWTIDGDTLSCTTSTLTSIRHRAAMPTDFTVKLQWQWSAAAPDAAPPRFGVMMRDTDEHNQVVADFRPWSNKVVIELDNQYTLIERQKSKTPFDLSADKWHGLELTRTGSTITLTLDGVRVLDKVEHGWLDEGTPILGLVVKPNKGAVNVKVREISVTPRK